jgi:hypothetical protein
MNKPYSICLRERLDLMTREFINKIDVSQLDRDVDKYIDKLIEMFYDELQYKYRIKR